MGEVLSSGISKDDRKKVLDAARGSRSGEIVRHLEKVTSPNDLRLFRTFAATNWTSTLRQDQLNLVLTVIDTRLRALGIVEVSFQAQGSSVPDPKGPAKGAEPKEAIPQASAKTGGDRVVSPQLVLGKPVSQVATKPVDTSASPASVRSAVSSAASAVSAEKPPVSRERPPDPKGPAQGAAPKADVYQGEARPRSREGR